MTLAGFNMRKIIIDTDIGDDIDDAFAIELALRKNNEILGITTSYRNAKKRAKIVKALLDANGRTDVEVYAGCDKPLKENIIALTYEKQIEKDENGEINIPHYFDEFNVYEINEKSAIDFILETAEKYPNEVTLVCLAPLTNIAKAYLTNPQKFSLIKDIVLMGGQEKGDFAEWNFRCDAYSAKTVFESGTKIKEVGINVTKHCILNREDIYKIYSCKKQPIKLISRMLFKWIEDNNYEKCPTMHDALAIAEIDGDYCKYIKKKVTVVEKGEDKAKIIRTDIGEEKEIAISVDNKRFKKDFLDYILN